MCSLHPILKSQEEPGGARGPWEVPAFNSDCTRSQMPLGNCIVESSERGLRGPWGASKSVLSLYEDLRRLRKTQGGPRRTYNLFRFSKVLRGTWKTWDKPGGPGEIGSLVRPKDVLG